ncbi:MAG: alanine racemase [Candidatus Methylophosphatis roskildensis]
MPRPISATIDLASLRNNLAAARSHAGGARVWCVVKANAYGHGIGNAATAWRDTADGFALLDLDEAVRLRESGIRQPILLLEGAFEAADLLRIAEFELTPVIHHADQVDMIMRAGLPGRMPVYLKANTGMNRLGLTAKEWPAALAALRACPQVGPITLMTHFADADGDRGIDWQLQRFEGLCAGSGLPRSLSNSAALLRYPEVNADWVRPGIMLYGGSPFPARQSAAQLGLRAVMTLRSQLICVRDVDPGDTVGYGCVFAADRPMRIGVVACGYADGYPRHAPTGTPVNVAGRMTRTLGRVSMDMIVVDLDHLPEAGVGVPVVLWGEGCPADDVATAAGTVSYELFCALAPRVPVTVIG